MSQIRLLYRHQRVTIMGLGLFGGGAGAARFWSELGADVIVTDLRDEATLEPAVRELRGLALQLVLGRHREQDFKGRDLIVVNPAVKPDNRYLRIARSAGARLLTEVGLVFRLARGPIIAVTGSNGKSTTTALLGTILQRHDPRTLIGGNLGGSLLGKLKKHTPSAPIVLEVSSFQLHYLKEQRARPHIAVITNLSPNHLDWHGSVLRYYEDKKNITRFQTTDDTLVLNAEDECLRLWSEASKARILMVARADPEHENACFSSRNGAVIFRMAGTETEIGSLRGLRLSGEHNIMNALQASAAAYLFSRNSAAINQGLAAFTGLPHRLEPIADVNDVSFINDSIATTPESTIAALNAFTGPITIIAGGYDKGIDLEPLGRVITQKACAAVLIGKTAPAIHAAISKYSRKHKNSPQVLNAGKNFEQAVQMAMDACPRGGVVLLSPACASYDMFTNFEERGERFRLIVQNMKSRGQNACRGCELKGEA